MIRPEQHQPSVQALHQPARNPGTPLDIERLGTLRVNTSAVERRAATLATRRSLKRDHQAAWLLKAISCIDLTTLAGDDTPGRVGRICAKARQPVRSDLLEGLGVADLGLTVGAVCVYHEMVAAAFAALAGSGIPVAAVSAGFPAGLSSLKGRIAEVEASVAAGAAETGKRFTTRFGPFARPRVRRISRPFWAPAILARCAKWPGPVGWR